MRRTILTLACAIAAGGCYSYQPVETAATPKAGERVRVELTRDGTTELARYLGPSVVEAEGVLMSAGADRALVIAVDFVKMSTGFKQQWAGEGQVTFPAQYIAGTRQRTYEKRRSIVASVAGGSALILIAVLALQQAGAFGGGDGGGTPPPP